MFKVFGVGLLSTAAAGLAAGVIFGVTRVGVTAGMLIGDGASSLRSVVKAERTARGRISL